MYGAPQKNYNHYMVQNPAYGQGPYGYQPAPVIPHQQPQVPMPQPYGPGFGRALPYPPLQPVHQPQAPIAPEVLSHAQRYVQPQAPSQYQHSQQVGPQMAHGVTVYPVGPQVSGGHAFGPSQVSMQGAGQLEQRMQGLSLGGPLGHQSAESEQKFKGKYKAELWSQHGSSSDEESDADETDESDASVTYPHGRGGQSEAQTRFQWPAKLSPEEVRRAEKFARSAEKGHKREYKRVKRDARGDSSEEKSKEEARPRDTRRDAVYFDESVSPIPLQVQPVGEYKETSGPRAGKEKKESRKGKERERSRSRSRSRERRREREYRERDRERDRDRERNHEKERSRERRRERDRERDHEKERSGERRREREYREKDRERERERDRDRGGERTPRQGDENGRDREPSGRRKRLEDDQVTFIEYPEERRSKNREKSRR
ncbi:hypothetical protein CC1G_11620 [Coprinopsis cinerea okayama7|uniref:Uncharacterized protein n=1 Tax=Coprinopsis cinerea (strain Okayama-7 / 130 / ATCC MYA-4618 / FGSC 9003) TaxID=240176 RepID=A8PCS9_COPC7|nr:hypothetical protein CC1G_11620 [Coprinopsis cinerea okayama7\|eukprot:XP_001840463.1 hypothetical protein CC1G_11620 [Coprinopsis cinerea okayama7\